MDYENYLIEDVSKYFHGCVMAEKKDKNVLILYKLDKPITRFDGKKGSYELEYRWLSQDDVHCVLGNEFTIWQRKELDLKKHLFDQLQLF